MEEVTSRFSFDDAPAGFPKNRRRTSIVCFFLMLRIPLVYSVYLPFRCVSVDYGNKATRANLWLVELIVQEVQRVRSEKSELQRAHEDLVMRAAKVCSHKIAA